jgi:hypothetical protein
MAVVLFAIMRFVFFVPIVGNVMAMMFWTLVYVFALLSLGLLVGTKAENQMQALQMSMVFLLPSVFFSGFIFPREDHAMAFLRAWRALPNHLFHLAYARDHSAGRELLRILAAPRNSYRDVDPALRSLRSAISEEDRLISITDAARLQSSRCRWNRGFGLIVYLHGREKPLIQKRCEDGDYSHGDKRADTVKLVQLRKVVKEKF